MATLLNINFAYFGNKTPWNPRHIAYQYDEKGIHNGTKLSYIFMGTKLTLFGDTSSDWLILSCFLYKLSTPQLPEAVQ